MFGKSYLEFMTLAALAPAELALAGARIGADANYIVAMRTAGMMGLTRSPRGEVTRMVVEKPYAAVQSALAAGQAMVEGKSPDQVMAAALMPIERRTRCNAARLSRAAKFKG